MDGFSCIFALRNIKCDSVSLTKPLKKFSGFFVCIEFLFMFVVQS